MNFDEVIREIVAQIASGDADWRMPWHGKKIVPLNVSRGVPYRGINRLILWARYRKQGWEDRHWGTFGQWRLRKEPVKKGEKGTALVLPVINKNRSGEEELAGFRRFWVFNGDQVLNRNIHHPDMFGDYVENVPDVDEFVSGTGASIKHGGDRACYIRKLDLIEMPDRDRFFSTRDSTAQQNYYSTLLHELVHWTSHASRENRGIDLGDASSSYAFEELVAELGSAFLCADFQLEDVPRQDHAQYLNSWLNFIEDKPTWFWRASSLAQQAVNYLREAQPEEPPSDESSPGWFQAEPTQVDMLAPELLGTGRK